MLLVNVLVFELSRPSRKKRSEPLNIENLLAKLKRGT